MKDEKETYLCSAVSHGRDPNKLYYPSARVYTLLPVARGDGNRHDKRTSHAHQQCYRNMSWLAQAHELSVWDILLLHTLAALRTTFRHCSNIRLSFLLTCNRKNSSRKQQIRYQNVRWCWVPCSHLLELVEGCSGIQSHGLQKEDSLISKVLTTDY
jgi:hypothetical protein